MYLLEKSDRSFLLFLTYFLFFQIPEKKTNEKLEFDETNANAENVHF